MFFAILEDISPILKSIEESNNYQYYKMGIFPKNEIIKYYSIFDVPNLGVTYSGDWNRIDSYLMLPIEKEINLREIELRTGEIKYAIDQMINISSMEVKIGGVFTDKENVIVAGRISIISDNDFSNSIYKLFSNKIKKEFKKAGTFYIGKGAEANLSLGWRLVTMEKMSTDFDLSLDEISKKKK